MESLKSEINQSRAVIAISTIIAIIIGFVSAMLEVWIASLTGIILLVVLGILSSKIATKKIWISNGLIIYLFVWFVSWVLFFNILV